MPIAQSMLPEFDQEMTTTRKMLERVPADKVDWKPHPRSMSLGGLSLHVANLVFWASLTLETDELDLAPPDGPAFDPPVYSSPADTLAMFDRNVKAARAALEHASDVDMRATWTLKKAGAPQFSLPRAACLRMFVLNHLIHHRGQLTVYLRQCDVPLPQVYGPTADEA